MKKSKTQKGITLIALIITIIVLLILAVVAINAIQNDGIIEHAKNARESYQTAQTNEQAVLDSYLSKLEDDKSSQGNTGNQGNQGSTGNEEKIKITLTGTNSVNVRSTITLTATTNKGATISAGDLIWDSSDKTVATVSNGVVTGVKALEVGTARTTITATSKTDSSVVATKEISVTPIECTACRYGYLDEWESNSDLCPYCGKEYGWSLPPNNQLIDCPDCGIIVEASDYAWEHEGSTYLRDINQYLIHDEIVDPDSGEPCSGGWWRSYKRCPNNCTYGKFYK